jgi:phospholipid/cholesterol/gamma-HCH transport system permease protein
MAPSLNTVRQGPSAALAASGRWTVAEINSLQDLAIRVTPAVTGETIVAIDGRGITGLDTYGAMLLRRVAHLASSHGGGPPPVDLPERFRELYDAVVQSASVPATPAAGRGGLVDRLARVGTATTDRGYDLAALAHMLGAICVSALRAITHPASFRLTPAIHHIDRVALQAVPIVLLITFLIGGIIAQQGIFHFRKFGADVYVIDMVGILVLREIGVLIVAIMVAGRSGSSYTAEIGSMKMREEIDALQTMGLDPVDVLVLPRILALMIGLPILTFLGSMSALYGAEVVCWFYGGMSPEIFLARLKEAISMTHFKVGIIKAPFMALVIGVVACAQGLQVKGSAESLGLQTTASVVKSIFLVIILDGLFAVFFASIDM